MPGTRVRTLCTVRTVRAVCAVSAQESNNRNAVTHEVEVKVKVDHSD